MKKSTSIWMAVLTMSAILMGVILLATPSRDASAMMVVNQNNLTMMTAGQSQGGDEFLLILDKSTGRLLAYRMDGNQFQLVGGENMNTLFSNAPAQR